MILDKLIIPSLWFTDVPCIRPNPSEGRCEHNTAVEVGSTVKSGDHCYSDAKVCCESPEMQYFISTPSCLNNSRGYGYVTCDDAVSSRSPTTNQACQAVCRTLLEAGTSINEDNEWNASCRWESYGKMDDGVVPTGSCFNNWVYGHADPMKYSSRPLVIHGTETPALCQAQCQANMDCVGFEWSPAQDSDQSNGLSLSVCTLKSKEHIRGAFGVDASDVDTQYCPPKIPSMCEAKLLPCLACDQTFSCVWASTKHISGWRYCDDKLDACYTDPISTTLPPTILLTTSQSSTEPSTVTSTVSTSTPSTTAVTTTPQVSSTTRTLSSNLKIRQISSSLPASTPAKNQVADGIGEELGPNSAGRNHRNFWYRSRSGSQPDGNSDALRIREEVSQAFREIFHEDLGDHRVIDSPQALETKAGLISSEKRLPGDESNLEDLGEPVVLNPSSSEDSNAESMSVSAELTREKSIFEGLRYQHHLGPIVAEDPDAEWISDEARLNWYGRTL